MKNKRRNRTKRTKGGKLSRALKETKLAANVTEEQDWYLDSPDVRLTRIFTVVLILHVVAVGGILAFKMIDKASRDNGVQLAAASSVPSGVVKKQSVLAGKIPKPAPAPAVQASTEVPGAAKISAPPVPATDAKNEEDLPAPLRKKPGAQKQYRVLAGDTLPSIAAKVGVDANALRTANGVRSDNELYPGRWLDIPETVVPETVGNGKPVEPKANPAERIAPPATIGNNKPVAAPAPQAAAPAPPRPAEITAAPVASGRSHTVQPGETIWAIARKHNVNHKVLLQVNGITQPESLQIGQTLKLPQ